MENESDARSSGPVFPLRGYGRLGLEGRAPLLSAGTGKGKGMGMGMGTFGLGLGPRQIGEINTSRRPPAFFEAGPTTPSFSMRSTSFAALL